MKNPQGREAKKPKKSKGKTQSQIFENAAHRNFQVPKTEIDPNAKKP
jgi:hypothetical protein